MQSLIIEMTIVRCPPPPEFTTHDDVIELLEAKNEENPFTRERQIYEIANRVRSRGGKMSALFAYTKQLADIERHLSR